MLKQRSAAGLLTAILGAGPLSAAVPPEKTSPAAALEFRDPRLHIDNRLQRVFEQPASRRASLLGSLAELRVGEAAAYLDPRTGRFATLLPAEPLLPGAGEGNTTTWEALGRSEPSGSEGWKQAAWDAIVDYVGRHARVLGIDVRELARPGSVSVHDGGAIVQIHAPRTVGGVPVRDSHLTAVINHGNLVLFGAHNWGTVRVGTSATLSAEQAELALGRFLGTAAPASSRRAPSLALVPLSAGPLESLAAPDTGLDFRLVWVLSPQFAGDLGTWEALVDAHTGGLIAFTDTNQYQSVRRVQGGVYPVSNDQAPPDGVEQPGWPFPFADVATSAGSVFTDTGGNLPACATGSIASTLSGRFVRVNDACGPVSLAGAGDLDFGVSGGTNCTTPGIGGAGNTHAARTAFHELNKLIEMARGQLPGNAWLQQPLTANTNINLNCGAFWNGTLNLLRQGGGCSNAGEIAGVLDHEWGHGLDLNDTTQTTSNPAEGIADVYMALRLQESCVGRNMLPGVNCGGYGNPCLACTGLRELDWDRRALHQPATVAWIDSQCGAGSAPCGGGAHCESAVYSEAVWDLLTRDLPAAGHGADTAQEIATRTTYIGAGPVTQVFQCVQGSGGCGASGAYLNFLAADDDDGNVATGTPHFQAIRAAFDRHGIACPTPAASDRGCPNAPSAAPAVTGAPEDKGARLSWTAVPGAVKYRVYRTEGVFGCDFGKVLLGETFGAAWTDVGLQNGRAYFYTVAAVGLANTCLGPMSSCTTVTPAPGPNLGADPAQVALGPVDGDGDAFIDNCETWTVSVPVSNTGAGPATSVRIAEAAPLSHPGMIVTVSPGTPAVAPCAVADLSFSFRAVDLTPGDTVRFRVDLTSDEMAPAVRSYVLALPAGTEGNHQFFASRTFDFESDAEGWQPFEGTFDRTNAPPGGSGGPGTFHFASSSFLGNRCDEVRSPVLSLTATSTLSVQDNFDIEPNTGGAWFDRANLARVDVATGERTVVSPDGGRAYNASGGSFTACGLAGQPGWAGSNPTWAPSTWSAAALGSGTVSGQPTRLSLRYGTDGVASGAGFRFDAVTVTDVNVQVADAQSDQCVAGNLPPVANADISNSPTLGPVAIPVLSNDSEPDGQCMRVVSVTTPANGTAIVNSVGCPDSDTVTYVPNLSCGLPCNDSFQYAVSDQHGGLATATVTVNQVPVELQSFKVE